MKRLFRRSCLGLLLFVILGGMVAFFIFAIVFQQSQAISSNAGATTAAQATSTRPVVLATVVPPLAVAPVDEVTIQIDVPSATDVGSPAIATEVLPSSSPIYGPTSSIPPESIPETTDVPRYSGTSSYPLTVTAEVMLGQTHVANYQAGVAATRTVIAAESASVFATLTADAPTLLPSVP